MKRKDKKQFLRPIFENIPEELKLYTQWVCWRQEMIGDKHKKVAYNPVTGKRAKTNDSEDWSDFKTAVKTYGNGGKFDGIGFVLTSEDPFVGWDIDDCRNPEDGKIESDILKMSRRFNSYTEVSPSGKGIRIFVEATLPCNGRKKGNFEVYKSGRYLSLTGCHIDTAPTTIEKRWVKNGFYYSKIFGQDKKSSVQKTSSTDHKEILKQAFRSNNGHEIQRLYAGDTGNHTSHSEADLALCGYLAFWFNNDMELIDRAFRLSGLYREKWDKKHYSDGRTYGQGTIQKAIESNTTTNKPKSKHNRSENTPLTVISASDLLQKEFPRDPFVIGQGILPEQGGLILAAESGVGKSLLLLDWAIHLALGRHLLNGKLTVLKPRRVMIFQSENILFMMQDRFKKMLKGLTIKEPLSIHFSTPFRYDINNENCVSQMIDVIGGNESDVVIADPLSSFHQCNENDNVLMRSVLDRFTHISRVTNTTMIISHHYGKPQKGRDEAYRFRGAASIKDWATTRSTFNVHSTTMHGMTRKQRLQTVKLILDRQ